MPDAVLHPSLALIAAAALLPFLRGPARSALILGAPLAALFFIWQLPDGGLWRVEWLGYELQPLAADRTSRLFASIFSLAAFAGGWFALRQQNALELPAAFVYAASAVGVVFAGDLITLFVFWEVMAIGSTLVLWSAGTPAAWQASRRYLLVHLFGGVLLFAGVAGHIVDTGSTAFVAMQTDSVAHWLIFAGFLVNAAGPLVSAWLPDAYPEASWSGTVFLSAFTTKTAVYVLLRGFPGVELLIWIGAFMIVYGIVYALLESDMRRILAYAIINQVGVMLVGVGIGTEMALNGVAAHAFVHVAYKALLLMAAGSVLLMTGRRHCADLGGLYRTMPLTTLCCLVGALTTASFPLTAGFLSKSMIAQSAAEAHLVTIWLLLAGASAGVVLHAGLRFPWLVFFNRDSGLRPADPPASMRGAMGFLAVLCVGVGLWPGLLYGLLPFAVDYQPYTAAHVVTQLQLLFFAAIAFVLLHRFLQPSRTVILDTDWIYRVLFAHLERAGRALVEAFWRLYGVFVDGLSGRTADFVGRETRPAGLLVRHRSTRDMATWVMVLLMAYLAAYYVL